MLAKIYAVKHILTNLLKSFHAILWPYTKVLEELLLSLVRSTPACAFKMDVLVKVFI